MPMSYEERAKAARTPSGSFPLSVQTALVKHAKFRINNQASPENLKTLARSVVNNPEAYAGRVALSVLTEPAYDAIADVSAISDAQLQSTIEVVFPLFAEAV